MNLLSAWNIVYGSHLPVSKELLDATFFSLPEDHRFIFEGRAGKVFLKMDGTAARVHFVAPLRPDQELELTKELAAFIQSKRNEIQQVIFGGGDRHIFPGVPLFKGHSPWLEFFKPTGPVVMDFSGNLVDLEGKYSSKPDGMLKSPRKESDAQRLLSFVQKEFPGRWAREILIDKELGFLEHYYSYIKNGSDDVLGYVRLYGWRSDFWAPGVYFSGPGKSNGGLGPIGVGAKSRGQGFGAEILTLSWKQLLHHGCKTVRIDWTTERNFYERAGLRMVQEYQPASFDFSTRLTGPGQ